jgi:uncharacterized RDD family membrane protein YckC
VVCPACGRYTVAAVRVCRECGGVLVGNGDVFPRSAAPADRPLVSAGAPDAVEMLARASRVHEMLFRRWLGTVIDFVMLVAMLVGPFYVLGDEGYWATLLVWLGAVVLYYPILEGFTGRTLGKVIARTKVVDDAGNAPGLRRAIVRTLVRLIEVNPVLLGGIPAALCVVYSAKHQRLGDMAADTYVLTTRDLARLRQGAVYRS